jgi:hypothetical protein
LTYPSEFDVGDIPEVSISASYFNSLLKIDPDGGNKSS